MGWQSETVTSRPVCVDTKREMWRQTDIDKQIGKEDRDKERDRISQANSDRDREAESYKERQRSIKR